MSLTQDSVLGFLLDHGGSVKNSELLNHFRSVFSCGDPAEKQHNREIFKRLVNSVAVVKHTDEGKFVAVKRKYQDFGKDVRHRPSKGDSFSSQNSSFSCASPNRAEPAGLMHSDIENNNVSGPSYGNCSRGVKHVSAESTQKRRMSTRNTRSSETTTVKVLNLSGDEASRAGRSGAVFAVIAVKSPPRGPSAAPRDGPVSSLQPRNTSDKQTTQGDKVCPQAKTPSDSSACVKEALLESQSWKTSQTVETRPPGGPQVRPLTKSTRQKEDAKYCESVPLDPLAHEWLVKCAAGLWGHMHALLLRDARLVQRRDFMSGFTALHWAAKDGNCDMIHKLVNVSQKRGVQVDVNSKAHGGYTPLHIAAIHGRTAAMEVLVQNYGAHVNERDHDGKKAVHYLGAGVSSDVRALVGGVQRRENTEEEEKEEEEEEKKYKEQAKSFNTISKLFQPHIGKKQKTKFTHDS